MIRSLAAGALLLLGAIGSATAQEPGRVYRIGVLSPSAGLIESVRRNTLPELAKLGFVEGRNLVVEERSGEASSEQLALQARALAAAHIDAFIAVSDGAIAALKKAAPRVPVVMSFAGFDPVASGFVETLTRPGGMITGTWLRNGADETKRLELLRDVAQETGRVRLGLISLGAPGRPFLERMQESIRLRISLQIVQVDSYDEILGGIAKLQDSKVDAVAIATTPESAPSAPAVAEHLTRQGLPTICEFREMARAGCLLSYGPNNRELRRRTAHTVARILRGQAPGEIPVEEPSVFELAVNLQTARKLGITLPAEILARADDVVD